MTTPAPNVVRSLALSPFPPIELDGWHSRAEVWGAGVIPRRNDGSVRPFLRAARYFTVHHTGAGAWTDPDDTAAELVRIQEIAAADRKPWEYNDVADSAGDLWEYAGDYEAAHSAGENDEARGCLLLTNNVVERPTIEMLDAVRRLRAELVRTRRLAEDHEMRRHLDMPGAATSCPNLTAEEWAYVTTPWEDEEMKASELFTMWRPFGYRNVFLVGTGGALHLSPELAGRYTALGVPMIVEDHEQTLASCLATSGLDAASLVPYPDDPGE